MSSHPAPDLLPPTANHSGLSLLVRAEVLEQVTQRFSEMRRLGLVPREWTLLDYIDDLLLRRPDGGR